MNKRLFGITIITFLLLVISACNEPEKTAFEKTTLSVVDCENHDDRILHSTDYQERDNQRCEGIKAKETSASSSIDLISATVGIDYPQSTHSTSTYPTHLKLKFYLQNFSDEVNVVAQDMSSRDYVMDKVRPQEAWSNNQFNNFQWETGVLEKLKIKMSELGVVVWLGKPNYSGEDQSVAPVIFYHSKEPSEHKYQFVFRVDNEGAQLNYLISPKDGEKPIFSGPLHDWQNNRHYQGEWDASQMTEGWYKITIKGEVNGQDARRIINFYHKPV